MEQLIRVITNALVEHPEEIQIQVKEESRGLVYKLSVHPQDVGKIIGKRGRIAKALRTVVSSAARKDHKRVMVDIISEQ